MPSPRRPAPTTNILAGSGTGLLTNVNLAVTVSGFPPRAEPLKLAMLLRSTFTTLPSVSVTLPPVAPSDQTREPPLIVLP